MIFFSELLSTRRWTMLLLTGIAGMANAGILVIINMASEDAGKGEQSFYHILQFGCAVAVFAVAQQTVMVAATRRVEGAIHDLRMRLIGRIRDAEYGDFEKIGRGDIFGSVWKETQVISQAAAPMVIAVQGSILLLFCLAYIAYLSLPAVAITIVLTTLGGGIYLLRANRIRDQIRHSLHTENRMQEFLSDFLDGFREIKFSRRKSAAVVAGIESISDEVRELRQETLGLMSRDYINSTITFFIITGAVVFVVPLLSATFPEVVAKTSTASLFMIGPISSVITAVPILVNVQASIDNIMELESKLSEMETQDLTEGLFQEFDTMRMVGVRFSHRDRNDEPVFDVGPLNFTLGKGELVFITGGNGSGKTTFMQVFSGLRRPSGGVIDIDGTPVTDPNRQSYRSMFNVVYSDLHLFRTLHGLEDVDVKKVNALLKQFEINDKIQFTDGAFSTIDLSAGQRKRLALIGVILEARPILILDEWAADQDPQFRKKFYMEILPDLRDQGFTICAVSHDQMYFDQADRIVHMAEGKFVT
jgi:putative ATP-binding cassette transporter